ncbi:O-fucosyltransferase 35-like [Curcuma longa]|uniref:O-fucosyltransferase 35-like n=1 Tax=Curcuma longa TaxID=136217 RepID=UPI003D9DB1E7
MGYQPQFHHHHHHDVDGTHHQVVNSPRYAGSMTRRTHSFKRAAPGSGDIELQINSPRTGSVENPGSPVRDTTESPSSATAAGERMQGGAGSILLHHHQQNLRFRLGVPILGKKQRGPVEVGSRESKKVANFLFLVFISVCLVLGVAKIIASGWFSMRMSDTVSNYQDLSRAQHLNSEITSSHASRSSSDSERTLKTIPLSISVNNNSAQYSGIWAKPKSENFTKCIDHTTKKKMDAKTNGYILINANGGLNQMRFGICDMVAVAKIMKATLVLPSLDHNSYWADNSGFKDLFDWKHFIDSLKDEVHIVETLPAAYTKVEPFLKTPISWSKGQMTPVNQAILSCELLSPGSDLARDLLLLLTPLIHQQYDLKIFRKNTVGTRNEEREEQGNPRGGWMRWRARRRNNAGCCRAMKELLLSRDEEAAAVARVKKIRASCCREREGSRVTSPSARHTVAAEGNEGAIVLPCHTRLGGVAVKAEGVGVGGVAVKAGDVVARGGRQSQARQAIEASRAQNKRDGAAVGNGAIAAGRERLLSLYEKDMLAFTGCSFNLTSEEEDELRKMRYEVSHWKEKEINGTERRSLGGCPLTPRETALLLKALGFPSSTKIYLVAGEAYGNGSMQYLLDDFPNIFSHATLLSEKELRPLQDHQNMLAGLDYIVALESDAFLYTYDGNMAKAVQGHRRFENFRKTISPDRMNFIKLVDEFDDGIISWKTFSSKVKKLHEDRVGVPYFREPGEFPKMEESFYANPLPGCICQKQHLVE